MWNIIFVTLYLNVAPDEFYDESVEQEKEFFDLTEIVKKKEKNKGVGILTAAKVIANLKSLLNLY